MKLLYNSITLLVVLITITIDNTVTANNRNTRPFFRRHPIQHHHSIHNNIDYDILQPYNNVNLVNQLNSVFDNTGRQCPDSNTNDNSIPSFSSDNVTLSDENYFSYRKTLLNNVVTLPYLGGIGLYDSVKVMNKDNNDTDIDLLSARLLTVPSTPPTIGIAYFDSDIYYNVSVNNDDAKANVGVGLFSSAMSIIFNKVFEYYDVDNNGQYDADTDIVVQSFDLGDQTWDRLCHIHNSGNKDQDNNNNDNDSDDGLNLFNATTVQSLANTPYIDFSIQLDTSNIIGQVYDYVVTPRNNLFEIQINNFPYKGYKNDTYDTSDTYICIETYVVSGSYNDSDKWNVEVKEGIISEFTSIHGSHNVSDNDLYLSWRDSVTVDHTSINDKGEVHIDTGNANIRYTYMDTNDDLPGLSGSLFFSLNPTVKVNKQKVYYSINTPQPTRINHKFTLSQGRPASQISNIINSKNVAILVGVLALITGVVGISWFGFRIYTERKQRHSDLIDDAHYQALPNQ